MDHYNGYHREIFPKVPYWCFYLGGNQLLFHWKYGPSLEELATGTVNLVNYLYLFLPYMTTGLIP